MAGPRPPRQRDELLRGLLARADKEPKNRQMLETLAVACLETSPQLDPALHTRIQAVAESLLPPKSVRQARDPRQDRGIAPRPTSRALSSRRPPVRRHHPRGQHGRRRRSAEDDRSLRPDRRTSVRAELLRAWPLFDPEEYARLVLSRSPHSRSLTMDDPSLLPGLRHLSGLEHLNVNFREGHGDLGILRDLPTLTGLNVMTDLKLRDLGPLTDHPALERVLLQAVGTVDIGPLATLPKLRYLYLRADR